MYTKEVFDVQIKESLVGNTIKLLLLDIKIDDKDVYREDAVSLRGIVRSILSYITHYCEMDYNCKYSKIFKEDMVALIHEETYSIVAQPSKKIVIKRIGNAREKRCLDQTTEVLIGDVLLDTTEIVSYIREIFKYLNVQVNITYIKA